eukprot:s1_g1434.t1
MRHVDPQFWKGKRVLITGHMGFKGVWLCRLMERLGAHTIGFGYDNRTPLTYREISLANHTHIEGDVSDAPSLKDAILTHQPDIVFHLAAQPLVIPSYDAPLITFRDNVMGVAHVLEAARQVPTIQSVVVVTSDKVYENKERTTPYVETESLGGHDPYSASKAAAEIVAQSMIACFFQETATNAATARAGNVIGGGDWAEYRLIVDAANALSKGAPLTVRNPASTRPWQHVLDPLSGYVVLAETLAQNDTCPHSAFNFGPSMESVVTVEQVANIFVDAWGGDASWVRDTAATPSVKEAGFLAIDSRRAHDTLSWSPRWSLQEALEKTARWYRDHAEGALAIDLMDRDIEDYFRDEIGTES